MSLAHEVVGIVDDFDQKAITTTSSSIFQTSRSVLSWKAISFQRSESRKSQANGESPDSIYRDNT